MSPTMSQSSLPVFEIGLNALSGVLDKAEAFAVAKKLDSSVLVSWRLAPDMFALARQIQIAELAEQIAMPANNLSVVFRRAPK